MTTTSFRHLGCMHLSMLFLAAFNMSCLLGSSSSSPCSASGARDSDKTANGTSAQNCDASVSLPNFSLKDENEASFSYEQTLSLVGYVGQISVWYFLHST